MKLDEFTHTNSADISFLLFLSLGFIHIYVCLYGSYEKWGKMTMIMAIEEAQDIRALQKKNRRMGKKLENPLMSSPCMHPFSRSSNLGDYWIEKSCHAFFKTCANF